MADASPYRGGERPGLLITAGRGFVRALERISGKEAWKARLTSNHPPTLAVHRERVFVSCSGTLYCFDYWSGRSLWTQPSAGAQVIRPTGRGYIQVHPRLLVDGDQVFVLGAATTRVFHVDGHFLWGEEHEPLIENPCGAVPGRSTVSIDFTWSD